jgi:hypothetical protein
VTHSSDEDVSAYQGQLLAQLRHVENSINKFAIQNYSASGAVVLAYLADTAPLWAVTIIVGLLNLNFIIAIGVQVARLHKLFTMHSVVRNFWLESRPKLRAALETFLPSSQFPTWVSVVMVGGQLLPILFVGFLWLD